MPGVDETVLYEGTRYKIEAVADFGRHALIRLKNDDAVWLCNYGEGGWKLLPKSTWSDYEQEKANELAARTGAS